ncbi:MAG TPA: hypothetical protein ENN73_07205, partial [Firmicutes bacterium]|nr:hypothetical protein [Bacillota bacterium]
MRTKLNLTILMLFISLFLLGSRFLTKEESDALQEALSIINCKTEDLSFDKCWGEGEFLLEPVRETLDNPLSLPEISFKLMKNLTANPVQSSKTAREILNFKTSNPRLRKRTGFNLNNSDKFISELKQILEAAEKICGTPEFSMEQKELFFNSFLGENDSTSDTIKNFNRLSLTDIFLLFESFYPALETIQPGDPLSSISAEYIDEKFWIIVGNPGNHEYIIGTHPYEIIIDFAGDDVYTFSDNPFINSFHLIIDISGNDKYLGSEKRGPGSGLLGIGIVMDLEGNDEYHGNDFCFGAAIGGVGILIDAGGTDKYYCNDFCLGAGYFGLGLLFDINGDDLYESSRFSQGFASVKGIGVLSDREGNDIYITGRRVLHQPLYNDHYQSLSQGFSIGMRSEGFAGGIGLIHDKEGNDKYIGDVYAQGAGYWYSLGILIDEGGEDVYSAWIYGQGAGIHLASGCLIDLNGND